MDPEYAGLPRMQLIGFQMFSRQSSQNKQNRFTPNKIDPVPHFDIMTKIFSEGEIDLQQVIKINK